MTPPTQPDPDAGARFLDKLLTGDPERLDVATDAQVVALMDAEGVAQPEPDSLEALQARMERRLRERQAGQAGQVPVGPGATVTPLSEARAARKAPKKPASRAAWIAGTLAAAAAAAVVVTEGAALLGRHGGGPDDIGPDKPAPPLTAEQRARRLRTEALAACAAGDRAVCEGRLDEAKTLDPAGETDPRVVEARAWLKSTVPPSDTAPPLDLGPKAPKGFK